MLMPLLDPNHTWLWWIIIGGIAGAIAKLLMPGRDPGGFIVTILMLSVISRAVRAIGTERMENMGTYSTTFWFPVGTKPANVVEESVSLLFTLVQPGPECIGREVDELDC